MPSKRHKHEVITRINSRVGRDINRSIILNTVHRRQPISRAEISEITNLNKSTVSSIVTSLLDEDLLDESPDHGGGVGRNRVNLSITKGKHFVGAIAFDAPCTRVAIVDINGLIKAREEIWTTVISPENLVGQSIRRLQALQATMGKHYFHGIGASVDGIVEASQSKVVYAANLGWNNVDLSAIIHGQFPNVESIDVENNAKAAATAELLFSKHNLASSVFVYLLLTSGIRSGIAVKGRILDGHSHVAGEVGHMTLVDGGEPCQCGNSGCWEVYASDRAPVRWFEEARLLAPRPISPRTLVDVVDAARKGDADAIKAIRTWARFVGVGIRDILSILDPEIVIIGGSITQIWELVRDDLNDAVRLRGGFLGQRAATVLPTSLLDHPSLLGAAALSIRKVFSEFNMSY